MDWLRMRNIRIAVCAEPERELAARVAKLLGVEPDALGEIHILRKSIDARKRRGRVEFVYTVILSWPAGLKSLPRPRGGVVCERAGEGDLPFHLIKRPPASPAVRRPDHPPVVVGMGPAGLFAALTLAEAGLKPVVIERGDPAEKRQKAISLFWRHGELDPESNVQFGEGGAGFFSDGKLTTRIKDPAVQEVYSRFVEFGARENTLFYYKPHIGTDKLKQIVINIRRRLEELGCDIRFRTRLTGIEPPDAPGATRRVAPTWVTLSSGEKLAVDAVFLCTGHSARDVYEQLEKLGARLDPKDFAVGFRVEHPQEWANARQFGAASGCLEAADYALTHQDAPTHCGVYSFCVCPGGLVIASSSEPGGIVTNGMSLSGRRGTNINGGLVAAVARRSAETLPREGGWREGVEFQRAYERKAYDLTGGYRAPAQMAADFLLGRASASLPESTYLPGVSPADLSHFYPPDLTAALRRALETFDRRMPGFIERGLLIAPETRTSSPVRIARDEQTLQSREIPGLYPAGEGAGYAGGITSSAVDGIKAARAYLKDRE